MSFIYEYMGSLIFKLSYWFSILNNCQITENKHIKKIVVSLQSLEGSEISGKSNKSEDRKVKTVFLGNSISYHNIHSLFM